MKKNKKVKRVVLAVGYPLFYAGDTRRGMVMLDKRVSSRIATPVLIDPRYLCSDNKIRLVAEVLE